MDEEDEKSRRCPFMMLASGICYRLSVLFCFAILFPSSESRIDFLGEVLTDWVIDGVNEI